MASVASHLNLLSRSTTHPPHERAFHLGILATGLAASLATATEATICPFRLCTGHACPGCGMTRALAALVQGDLSLSSRYHPLAVVLAVQVAMVGALLACGLRLRRVAVPLTIANGVAMVVVWLIRWRFGLLDFVVNDT